MKEFLRVIKFTLISASAGLIEIGAFTLFNEVLHLPYWLGYLLALVLSVIWNFTLNRKYTFKSAANVPEAMLKVAAYYAVFIPLSTLLEHFLTERLGWNEYLVTAINMLLNFSTEFVYQRFFVFGSSLDTWQDARQDAGQDASRDANRNAGQEARSDAGKTPEDRTDAGKQAFH